MFFLIEITFEGETREMETEKPEVIVGRSTPVEEVDIDLSPDKMVSRKHIVLKMEYNMGTAKNEAWIHDQGSSRAGLDRRAAYHFRSPLVYQARGRRRHPHLFRR